MAMMTADMNHAPSGEGAEGSSWRVLRGDSLADFIELVRLRTDLDTMADDGHAVTLMTVDSEVLQFDCVFVAGMEESLSPHMNSVGDGAAVEEERRLAYVAITRARKLLYLTCAQQRQIFGQTSANPTSRFINEIPAELRRVSGVGSAGFSGHRMGEAGKPPGHRGLGCRSGRGARVRPLERIRLGGCADRTRAGRSGHGGMSLNEGMRSRSFSGAAARKTASQGTFAVGDTVDHKTFGRGKVTKVDGDTLHVKFAKNGQQESF